MRFALKPHPQSRCAAVTAIEVEVTRLRPAVVRLRYVVTGTMVDLKLPPLATPARTDGLWRSTCFEAFVRGPAGARYQEFNLSPSTQWAAYRFDGYRQGMAPADLSRAPLAEVKATDRTLILDVSLDLGDVEAGRLGLSAVIEETDGRISYWALAHPPGKPDFHHADCFALELPATERP